MALVYLIYSYNEDGPRNLVATLDIEKVVSLAKAFDTDNWFSRVGESPIPLLIDVLKEHGNTPEIYSLMSGWGGLVLEIVELS